MDAVTRLVQFFEKLLAGLSQVLHRAVF